MATKHPKRLPKSWKLEEFEFDETEARSELATFKSWIKSNQHFSEVEHVMPELDKRRHFCAALGKAYGDQLFKPNRFAFELGLGGNYFPDIVIGDSRTESLLLVEIEGAQSTSVFAPQKKDEQYPDFSSGFKVGFFQLLDWRHRIRDASKDEHHDWFTFVPKKIRTLLVIGRNRDVGADPKDQGRRRMNSLGNIVGTSNDAVFVVTFDTFVEDVELLFG